MFSVRCAPPFLLSVDITFCHGHTNTGARERSRQRLILGLMHLSPFLVSSIPRSHFRVHFIFPISYLFNIEDKKNTPTHVSWVIFSSSLFSHLYISSLVGHSAEREGGITLGLFIVV